MNTAVASPPVSPTPAVSLSLPVPSPLNAPSYPTLPSVRRFTVAEYHRMIRDGYFAHDERFELIDGLILRKMPKDPIHEAVLFRSNRVLTGLLPAGWHVRMQGPVTMSTSEPEPDLSVAPGDELDWGDRHPGPADVPFVVEVSRTTLADDRQVKGPLYARAGILTYVILNVVDWRAEVYSDPSGDDPAPAYRHREDLTSGRRLTVPLPGSPAGLSVAVDDLLPPKLRPAHP